MTNVSGLVYPGILDAQRMFEERLMGERIAMALSVIIASVVMLALLEGAI